MKGIAKKAGGVVIDEPLSVSKNGKRLTTTFSGKDPTGKAITSSAVFDKP